MRVEDPGVAAGVDRGVLVVVAGGQGEDEVQALPVGAAEQRSGPPLQHQRADDQVALAGAPAVRAAVDIEVQAYQRQQHFGAVVGAEQGVLAEVGEVRQQCGATNPLPTGNRMPAGVAGVVRPNVLQGQFEEHAGTADAVHEAGVAERQRRQRDGVGAGLQAERGGEGAEGG